MSPAGSRGLPGWPLPLLLCRQPVQKAFAPTGAQALLLPQRPRSPLKATEDLAAFLAQESRSGSVLAEAGVLVPDRRISAKAGPDRCMSPSPDAGCSWGPASHRGPRENARTGPGPTRELPDCAPSLSDDLAQLAIALAQPPSSHGPFHVQHKEAKSPGTKIQRAKSPKSQIATSPPKKRKEAKAASEAEDAKGAKPVTPTPPKKAYRRRSSALSSDPRAQRPRQSEIERQMQASTPIPERNLSAKPTPKQISSATKEALRSRRSVFLPSSKRRDDEDLSAMAMLAQALEASRASLEVRMAKLASQLRVPLDVLNQAYEVFDVLSDKKIKVMKPGQKEAREFDVFQDAELSEEGFAKVLCTLMNVQDTGELPEGLLHRSFADADTSRNKHIGFLEFALWYSRHGFMENVLLTDQQRELRAIARRNNIPVTEVEQYKRKFDIFDEDDSGAIDYAEFEKLLNLLVKVPAHCELNASRIKRFWMETDKNKDGALDFEAFLHFYQRYFHQSQSDHHLCPFEEYYRGIRRVNVRRYENGPQSN
mmetsp:Transcript_63891/g.115022  ORF Transcript_63891/g.115022 Transcript_63891/m.115022 type:complete len:538 (+) Transcript_63891:111-1724(+)